MAYANRGLFCPKCGGKTFVSYSVEDKENNEVYRERTCVSCSKVFYTTEFIVEDDAAFRELWYELRNKYQRERKKEREKK